MQKSIQLFGKKKKNYIIYIYIYYTENADFLAEQNRLNLKPLDPNSCVTYSSDAAHFHSALCLPYPFYDTLFPSSRRGGCTRAPVPRRKRRPCGALRAAASRRLQHWNHNSCEIVRCHFEEKNPHGMNLYPKAQLIFRIKDSSLRKKSTFH